LATERMIHSWTKLSDYFAPVSSFTLHVFIRIWRDQRGYQNS